MKKITTLAIASLSIASLVAPLIAIGVIETPPSGKGLPGEAEVPDTGSDVLDTIGLIANWLFAIFVAISIIYLLLASFQFVTAGGDAVKVSEARQKLIYSIIGLVLALVVRGLPAVLRNIVL